MKINKIAALFCTAFLLAGSLSGCSSNSEHSDTASASDTGVLTVQVQSISGSTVNAVIGTLQELDRNDLPDRSPDDNSDMPERPDGDNRNGTMPEGEPPEKPDGNRPEEMTGDMPEDMTGDIPERTTGDRPDGNFPGNMQQFSAGTETLTFEITDSTAISVESFQGSQDGTAEDITENTVLEVTLDDDNNAVSIVVKHLPGSGNSDGRGPGPEASEDDAPPEAIEDDSV